MGEDERVDEFTAMKDAEVSAEIKRAEEKAGVSEGVLPGWGAWAGDGLSKHEKRVQKSFAEKIRAEARQRASKIRQKRKDSKSENIIFSASSSAILPTSYMSTVSDGKYDAIGHQMHSHQMKTPIGLQYQDYSRYNRLNVDEILVDAGAVIAPISKGKDQLDMARKVLKEREEEKIKKIKRANQKKKKNAKDGNGKGMAAGAQMKYFTSKLQRDKRKQKRKGIK
eukprot:gnl/Carplike_NY0171/4090_a5533_352.p1 GENE.gnl/Carplike_NY0171/4090_a5533_352~~gnl/Carplike_NY0171/4090_a5533_352.p1  ORF type:complete len:260 (-),score=105.35 gnl/Carplike_NY0171/4090_a5533_352:282-953(-)